MRSFLEAALRKEEEAFAARVILVSGELASNAIRHGRDPETEAAPAAPDGIAAEDFEGDPDPAENRAEYALPSSRSLRLEYLEARDWAAVRIVYRGREFPWHLSPKVPSMESLPSGGFGRFLIAAGADSVIYAGTGGGAAADLRLVCAVFDRNSAPSAVPGL